MPLKFFHLSFCLFVPALLVAGSYIVRWNIACLRWFHQQQAGGKKGLIGFVAPTGSMQNAWFIMKNIKTIWREAPGSEAIFWNGVKWLIICGVIQALGSAALLLARG